MNEDRLRILIHATLALSPDQDVVLRMLLDDLALKSLKFRDDEILFRQAFSELLRSSDRRPSLDLNQDYFRQPLLARVLLNLAAAKNKYADMAEWLGRTSDQIEEDLWLSRTQLAPQVPIPSPGVRSPSCPDYDVKKPWFQKYLDEQFDRADFTFLKAHLIGCPECARGLNDTRVLIDQAERKLPPRLEEPRLQAWLLNLQTELRQIPGLENQARHALRNRQAWKFFLRWETWAALAILGWILRHYCFL